jgi:GNAT superfamily N-acetyltransferase
VLLVRGAEREDAQAVCQPHAMQWAGESDPNAKSGPAGRGAGPGFLNRSPPCCQPAACADGQPKWCSAKPFILPCCSLSLPCRLLSYAAVSEFHDKSPDSDPLTKAPAQVQMQPQFRFTGVAPALAAAAAPRGDAPRAAADASGCVRLRDMRAEDLPQVSAGLQINGPMGGVGQSVHEEGAKYVGSARRGPRQTRRPRPLVPAAKTHAPSRPCRRTTRPPAVIAEAFHAAAGVPPGGAGPFTGVDKGWRLFHAAAALVAADGRGDIVGCVFAMPLGPRFAYFGPLAVRPSASGHGTGRLLASEAAARLRRGGAEHIEVGGPGRGGGRAPGLGCGALRIRPEPKQPQWLEGARAPPGRPAAERQLARPGVPTGRPLNQRLPARTSCTPLPLDLCPLPSDHNGRRLAEAHTPV